MERRILNPVDCLADDKFQDDLARLEVFVRSDPILLPQEELLSRESLAGQFRRVLVNKAGKIVTKEAITRSVKNNMDVSSEKIIDCGYFLSNRSNDEIPVTRLSRLGWSYGVTDTRLAWNQIPPVYRIWQELGHDVSDEEVTYSYYGRISPDLLHLMRSDMMEVARNILPSKARIIRTRVADGKYLYRLEEHQERELDHYLPSYFSLEFQNWLALPSVDILKTDFSNQSCVPKLTNRSSATQSLVELLHQYYGRIVPTNFISQELFGSTSREEAVNKTMAHARKTMAQENSIYTAFKLGHGLGIKELGLSKSPLIILNRLWRNLDSVALNKDLTKRDILEHELKFKIYYIRKILADSEYEIVTDWSRGYKLQKKVH